MTKSLSAIVVLMIVASAQVAAQEIPQQLTLEEAIRIALRSNPTHQQTFNDMEVENARVRARYGAFLPRVSLGTSFRSTYSETQSTLGDFGEPLSQPRAVISKTSSGSQSIGVSSITLFDGGRQFQDLAVAKTQRRATESNLVGAEIQLRATTTRLYYTAASAERRIELERQFLTSAKDRLDLTERQFRIAAAKQTDVLGARGNLAQQEQALADAEAAARRARLDLIEHLGIDGEPTFTLATELPVVVDPATLDVNTLVARALVSNPVVIRTTANRQVAEKQASMSKAARLPTISLGLPSYSWSSQERGLWSAWGDLGAPNNAFSFSVSMGFNLFTGFQTSTGITQSNAAAEDARYEERRIRLQTEKDVIAGMIDLDRLHRALQNADQQAQITQLRLELAQEEYQAGVTTFTTLQQIIAENDRAQRNAVDARINFMNARVNLEVLLGGPLTPNN